METIDLGDKCGHCKNDTSFGSGRFVNRYPVFGYNPNFSGTEYNGYCCEDCELKIQEEREDN